MMLLDLMERIQSRKNLEKTRRKGKMKVILETSSLKGLTMSLKTLNLPRKRRIPKLKRKIHRRIKSHKRN